MHFFETRVLSEFAFPIARVRTDRGSEFKRGDFLEALRRHHVKLRPNRAGAPHLNGKVERSQQTDRMEFCALEITEQGWHRKARDAEGLALRLAERQRFYNEERGHGSLGGRMSLERWHAVREWIPSREALDAAYAPAKEPR